MDISHEENNEIFTRKQPVVARYAEDSIETHPETAGEGVSGYSRTNSFKEAPGYPPTRQSTQSSINSLYPPRGGESIAEYGVQTSPYSTPANQSTGAHNYPPHKPNNYGVQNYPPATQPPHIYTTNKSTPELAHFNGSRANRQSSSTSNLSTPGSPTASVAHLPQGNTLEQYRVNAKKSNDPSIQFDFAKYLIETASNLEASDKSAEKTKKTLMAEALKWIKRLATQGMGIGRPAYPEAQFFLANCYGTASLGVPVDHEKAFNLYVQASKQNHPEATYRAAVCYEVGAGTKRDYSRAVQFFRKAAILGDTAAMYKLGMTLLKGLLNQNPNPREAITWLKRAASNADTDNPHALHELGLCYEKEGIPSIIPDETYARELYTQAAQLGYAPSQFKLGSCYEYGTISCPVDPRRSIAWYTRAAEQGDPEAELALSGWYLTGAEGILKQSDTEAYLWARKAADKGLAKAEYAVGYYSEVGIGVRQDLDEAKKWYMRAAAQGNKRAMQRLAELKKFGASGGQKQNISRDKQNSDGCVIC
ncbi:HCP-like protein [Basidiobolus meristosporus CBS 931.73]|uniref:HCP-like protein n=1 Tax=Basidiobolus meristosporus CBS 931.73 TaxID=1314790 RepID=A0A1Y1Y258_9FUNG|nr:HCP-like protein [Basidiobolus meristosporus CBS 931.73]|eukprot:ORX92101.1 HCP-like protein [Basidiobolus meristosporus CBS 931.73]